MTISPAEMGWMAAVIDLRGRVYVKTNKQRAEDSRQIVLMAESKQASIIRRLSKMTGNKVETMSPRPMKEFMRRGCNEHCPEQHVHISDDRTMPGITRWTLTGVAMAIVTTALEPYLTEDKGFPEYNEEILAATTLRGQGSGAVMATIARLSALGWPLPDVLAKDMEMVHEQLLQYAQVERAS